MLVNNLKEEEEANAVLISRPRNPGSIGQDMPDLPPSVTSSQTRAEHVLDTVVHQAPLTMEFPRQEYWGRKRTYVYLWLIHVDVCQKPTQYSEKAMAPHSSTLAWKIPWMEDPGDLPRDQTLDSCISCIGRKNTEATSEDPKQILEPACLQTGQRNEQVSRTPPPRAAERAHLARPGTTLTAQHALSSGELCTCPQPVQAPGSRLLISADKCMEPVRDSAPAAGGEGALVCFSLSPTPDGGDAWTWGLPSGAQSGALPMSGPEHPYRLNDRMSECIFKTQTSSKLQRKRSRTASGVSKDPQESRNFQAARTGSQARPPPQQGWGASCSESWSHPCSQMAALAPLKQNRWGGRGQGDRSSPESRALGGLHGLDARGPCHCRGLHDDRGAETPGL
ncbi:hypothetical protein MG293_002215 [Ovis ammon polii]|uniref:Uncharacterized protein n=1 Tax=Ovis ammon polii TaxID=230172 RepID=A0AAD4URY7_OVIAM|nr:hypothetical protein MG293_002215 [Ovis ammon polii]